MNTVLTFDGCTTREEARDRFRAFVELQYADNLRSLQTAALTSRDVPDIDSIDNVLVEAEAMRSASIAEVMTQFESVLDQVLGGENRG